MSEHVDLIIFNARIYTLDDNDSIYEAIACRNELIVELGSSDEILRDHDSSIKIDARRRAIIPGFIDLHAHLQSLGEEKLFVVDLRGAKSLEDAVNRIRERAVNTPSGDVIQARNWDESIWPEKRYLTRHDLDRATTSHPVVAYREDGHMVSLNSVAIEEVRLERLRGVKGIDLDPKTNELTGVVRDVPLDYQKLRPTSEQSFQAAIKGCEVAASLGITTAHDILKGYQIAPYLRAWRSGKLKIRITMIPWAKNSLDMLEKLGMTGYFGDHWLRFGAIKFFADGSIGARTACLSQPYQDRQEELGKLEYSLEKLVKELKRARNLMFPISVHAIGDKAIEMVLESLEHLDPLPSPPSLSILGDNHWGSIPDRIEHAEMLTDDLLAKVKELKIALSMQPNFLKWQVPNGLYEQRLGKERARMMNCFKKIVSQGIPLGFGSDCMPIGPMYGIHWAVNHPNPELAITVKEAMLAYTRWAADISGEGELKGTIERGKLADFIMLSDDPFKTAIESLKDIKVVMTVVGGKIVHDARNQLN